LANASNSLYFRSTNFLSLPPPPCSRIGTTMKYNVLWGSSGVSTPTGPPCDRQTDWHITLRDHRSMYAAIMHVVYLMQPGLTNGWIWEFRRVKWGHLIYSIIQYVRSVPRTLHFKQDVDPFSHFGADRPRSRQKGRLTDAHATGSSIATVRTSCIRRGPIIQSPVDAPQ